MVLIQTTLAMLAISRPDNLYVPDIAHATSLSDEDDQEDVLPNVDVHAIVYAYCERKGAVPSSDEYPYYDPSRHGRPVYVGQTMQTLAERDAQHIRCKDTPFDRQYGDRSQYVLVRLDERTFPRAASDNDFLEHTLRPAAEWMDVRETRRIKEFDTYHQGLNSTKGGQGRGWLVALREARAKMMHVRFATVYMPAFRTFYKEKGNLNVPTSHPVLGRLVNHIRFGHTAIPPQFEDELLTMGLDMRNQRIVQRDTQWKDEYMPALRKFYKEKGNLNVVPRSYPVLRRLLYNIRAGNTTIPPQFEDELLTTMGFDMRNQRIVQRDTQWENEYMPAFRTFYKEKGDLNVPVSHPVIGRLVASIRAGLTTIPPQFEDELLTTMGLDMRNQLIVQRDTRWEDEYMPAFRAFYKDKGHPNAPRSHPVLGNLLNSIRTDNTAIPPQFEDELLTMGLDMRNQRIVQRDTQWEDEYMPALRTFYKEKGHPNVPKSHPVLGMLVTSIRTGNTTIPPQFKDELRQMGLFWCTQNLARHVTRMLGRSVTSLEDDPDAARAVADAARVHATLLGKRAVLKGRKALEDAGLFQIPFGTLPLGDGVERFRADQLGKKRKRTH